jgi:hypothetical protein
MQQGKDLLNISWLDLSFWEFACTPRYGIIPILQKAGKRYVKLSIVHTAKTFRNTVGFSRYVTAML